MAYRVSLELTFTEGEAAFISSYGLNLAEIAVEAIAAELYQQHEIDKNLRMENPLGELMELKKCLVALRVENERLKELKKPGAFARIMGGAR